MTSGQARRRLVPRCKEILLEAQNAVRRLEAPAPRAAAAAGATDAGSGDAALDEEEDEVADVTEERRAAKRAYVEHRT